MNGLLLDETADYTSNGTAITLTSGASVGDEIEVVKYDTFSVGDAQTQAQADTRYLQTSGGTISGNLATSGTLTSTGLITASGGVAIGGTGAVNTLDDYEEGTWTGTLIGYHGNPNSHPVTCTGHYTKVGNAVHVAFNFENVDTTGAASNMWVTGLPFTSSGPYCIIPCQMSVAGTFGSTSPFGLISGDICYFYYHVNQSSTAAVYHNAGSGRYIRVSGTYKVA